ncbi:hypothetical protein QR685DRAFT_273743 [Neurospora intermedia]|uniref:Hydrophobin n=1 Tax=Neurospora intermedia TaxID=5142 RepID=A0ABR3DEJ3_NEUIN
MQFTSVFTILAIAMTAAAAPAEVVPRTTTIDANTCSIDDYKPYCCQSMSGPAGSPGLLNLIPVDLSASLGCVVGVIGSQCGASVKCCKDDVTNTGNSFLIINAANCVA